MKKNLVFDERHELGTAELVAKIKNIGFWRYYALMSWDEGGIPTQETRSRIGIDRYISSTLRPGDNQ